jgi:hypothetical protein
MFATIRRHQKWLWAVIITVIIISFVIFFSPNVSLNEGRRGNLGTMNGRAISMKDYSEAYWDVYLEYYLRNGNWPDQGEANRTGFDIEQQARNRLFLNYQVKANRIVVSDEAVAKWISGIFQDRQKKGFQQAYFDTFISRIKASKGLSENDFIRFVRHEVGVRELNSVYGVSGLLVTPREAEVLYQRENEQFVAQAVLFKSSNYLASVTVNATNLAQFFTNRMALYRTPERVQVSYVKFAASNFWTEADQVLAKLTNLTQIVDRAYTERGTNVFVGPDGKPLPEAAAKEKLRLEFRDSQAQLLARRKAGEFGSDLYDMKPMKAENLAKLAQAKKIEVKETAPFGQYEEVKGLNVLDSFNRAAFRLTEEEPISTSIDGEDGVYILAFKKKFPSEVPAYETISNKVAEDFRNFQAGELARQAGTDFNRAVSNGLAQGQTFTAICQAAKVNPVAVPHFSLSSRALPGWEDQLPLLKDLASNLTPGKASAFVPNRDGGLLLFLGSTLPADAAVQKKELPAYLEELRNSRQYQAFYDWITHQMTLANITEPARKTSAK